MMNSSSDGEYSEMEIEDNGEWRKVRHKRNRNRDPNSPTQLNPNKKQFPPVQEIPNIIMSPPINYRSHVRPTKNYQTTEGNSTIHTHVQNNSPDTLQATIIESTKLINKRNYSAKMKEITNKQYKHLFYIKTAESLLRKDLSNIWEGEYPNSEDSILSTKQGFLLKTNQNKDLIVVTLNKLVAEEKIQNFKETHPSQNKTNTTTREFYASYSVVVGSVEFDISEIEISEYLHRIQVEHRYCKRIIARATNKPTLMIRIITPCLKSSERLLNEGLFYKHRYYPVYPSNPPAPIPQPCSRCQSFAHTRENCTSPIKCTKCEGSHHYSKCSSQLLPKCVSCGSEDHAAWSLKCPRRPTKPIDGIPNSQIKPLNKKSMEIDKEIKKNTKLHSVITIHDMIIDTYIHKLNKNKNTNREELIAKLRKRFVDQYSIDTVAHFSGNRLYLLMFDLESPSSISPTQPIGGGINMQVHVET
ncbi:uncharacterized protein LOC123672365 [Harmonia axyridis]|uniref:uncharacterized protein LOC123672365 n=1 Tax=Harmonia axyridis TaxID=115357 RepID=UPI001E274FCA|nr:uncharacterized protein LOC123672365 [Harmonia axyridis]